MSAEQPERPFVLVAGACLGGWAWDDVAGRLREHGHPTYPLTLTGLGEREHLAGPDVDLQQHVEDVVAELEREDLADAILVGHSYAGIVLAGAAPRVAERLAAVVYLDTGPAPSGTAIVDLMPAETREEQRAAVLADGDGWRWPPPDRATLETGRYGSTSGLVDEHFALLAERATPQPYATFTSPLDVDGELPAEVRRVAIVCSAGGVGVEQLRALIAADDPRAAPFADPDWELHELATGHWAMWSAPQDLAELLERLAIDPARAASAEN